MACRGSGVRVPSAPRETCTPATARRAVAGVHVACGSEPGRRYFRPPAAGRPRVMKRRLDGPGRTGCADSAVLGGQDAPTRRYGGAGCADSATFRPELVALTCRTCRG